MKNIYHFDERKAIEEQAREWLVKIDSDLAPTQEEIAALQEWCARSPLHKEELIRISAFWDDADLLTKLAIPLQQEESRYQRSFFTLPVFYKTALAAVLLLALAMPLVYQRLDFSTTTENAYLYTTEVGEQLSQTLTDGSIVQLNTNSKLKLDYSQHTRKIHLLKGEAHFDVAPDPDRPFEVYAGQGMVRAIGTAFSVQVKEDDLKITVTEGIVDLILVEDSNETEVVTKTDNSTQALPDIANKPAELKKLGTLQSGQVATFGKTIKLVQNLTNTELSHELTWRHGFLIFNSTPLDQVVEEVSRYSAINIEIKDAELKDFKMGGRFKIGELEALFDVLENNFGIQVSRLDEQHIQLSSSNRQ